MDAFKDRLSERARDTGRPALAHQSRGRDLTDAETALAAALMDIYSDGTHDFALVAKALTERGVVAPISGGTDWTEESLAKELAAINADLEAAYQEHGYGA
ncbi:recombinase-like helix-turn-helix domain-containing protein [Maritimibacter sp. UBA3975]|uniref:recombinase-like helix-turn-helix domain-containing protein n=1 Tax=Maritimibacter sp. UBA3975 TaxID=1946833 RepID=UPI000C0A98F1|nr:recombinase-like helix-turn-helix domain-containing protein [Maritimibacter sp. UBA3975]MAM63190.1 hypothetical protein [Maritimibacter sp.]|tara:strand:+ start:14684 stop:14986 length:303 start_codon:yes stop_codon:yes gene_type:complete